MTKALENNALATAIAKFFRTRTDTPLRFARVLIGGTLGLALFAVGAPAMIYYAALMTTYLDWTANLFIACFTATHILVTQRHRIKHLVEKMREPAPSTTKSRVEPSVTAD